MIERAYRNAEELRQETLNAKNAGVADAGLVSRLRKWQPELDLDEFLNAETFPKMLACLLASEYRIRPSKRKRTRSE